MARTGWRIRRRCARGQFSGQRRQRSCSSRYAAGRLTTSPNQPHRLAGIAARCPPEPVATIAVRPGPPPEPIRGSAARGCPSGQVETYALLGGLTPPEHRACLSTSSTASAEADGLGRSTRPETVGHVPTTTTCQGSAVCNGRNGSSGRLIALDSSITDAIPPVRGSPWKAHTAA